MEEKRKYFRVDNALSVSYRILKGYFVSSSRSRNVSEGGICLAMHQKFDPGVVLALKIHILEWDVSIKAVGEVVWLIEKMDRDYTFLAGIKFIDIPPKDYEKLCRYIEQLKKINVTVKMGLKK